MDVMVSSLYYNVASLVDRQQKMESVVRGGGGGVVVEVTVIGIRCITYLSSPLKKNDKKRPPGKVRDA
jgi:hypothetical protein